MKTSNSSKGESQKDKPQCEHYNKPHHTKETCWKIHGKPLNWKPKNQRKVNQAIYWGEAEIEKSTNLILFAVESWISFLTIIDTLSHPNPRPIVIEAKEI